MTRHEKPAAVGGGLFDRVQLGGEHRRDTAPAHSVQLRYPDGPGWKGQSDTGQKAARGFAARSKSIRTRVLEVIERQQATAEQVADEIGEHFMIVRARCSELRAQGLVEDSGLRGDGALGGRVITWRRTTAEERAIHTGRRSSLRRG